MSNDHDANHGHHETKSVPEQPKHHESNERHKTPYDDLSDRVEAITQRWRQRSSFNWGHAIQLGILAAAAIYGAITFALWLTTDRTLSETRKQSQALSEQFAATSRAWIRVELAEVDVRTLLATMAEWKFIVHVSNRGRVPAENITIFWNVEIPRFNEQARLNYHGLSSRRRFGPLFPDESPTDAIQMTTNDGFAVAISPEDRESVSKGDRFIVLYDRISYSDAFGEHWAHQCFSGVANLARKYAGENCMKYNAVGNGKDPDPEPR